MLKYRRGVDMADENELPSHEDVVRWMQQMSQREIAVKAYDDRVVLGPLRRMRWYPST